MDYARTLMIEKNVVTKYWKEAINIVIHTLNQVQLKKGKNQTLMNYGMDINLM